MIGHLAAAGQRPAILVLIALPRVGKLVVDFVIELALDAVLGMVVSPLAILMLQSALRALGLA